MQPTALPAPGPLERDDASISSHSSVRSIVIIQYRRVLAHSRVYQQFRRNNSVNSFHTANSNLSKQSYFSQSSTISNIAVLNLPIDIREIPVGFFPGSSDLQDSNNLSIEDDPTICISTTRTCSISLQKSLRDSQLEAFDRKQIGFSLTALMLDKHQFWPCE